MGCKNTSVRPACPVTAWLVESGRGLGIVENAGKNYLTSTVVAPSVAGYAERLANVFITPARVRGYPQDDIDSASNFGYNIARMPYEIILSPEAVEDLHSLKAAWRATVQDAIKKHLRHTPTKESKSRIKRLRGISHPHYRLRVDDVRVFYDVSEETVEVLGIVLKSEAEAWLERAGKQNEANSVG